MDRDDTMHVRLPKPVKAALKSAAEADGRTMSSMCVHVLRTYVVENGFLEAPPAPTPIALTTTRTARSRR